MNNKIYKLGFKTGLLNYIDHETPRVYFIHAGADLVEFDDFCEALIKECTDRISKWGTAHIDKDGKVHHGDIGKDIVDDIKQHFGIE